MFVLLLPRFPSPPIAATRYSRNFEKITKNMIQTDNKSNLCVKDGKNYYYLCKCLMYLKKDCYKSKRQKGSIIIGQKSGIPLIVNIDRNQ